MRTDLQSLRGLSVILVVLFHIGIIPGGYIGVDVFFVISGFVIATSISNNIHDLQFSIRDFFSRRIRRIAPLFSLVTVVSLVGAALLLGVGNEITTISKTATGSAFLASNLRLHQLSSGYFATSSELNPLLHTWSLAVEEQFYLIFPFVCLLSVFRKGSSQQQLRRLFILLLFLGSVSLVFSVLLTGRSLDLLLPSGLESFLFSFYSPLVRAWEFIVGASIGVWFAVNPRSQQALRTVVHSRMIQVLILAIIVSSSLLLTDSSRIPGWLVIIPVFAAGVLMLPPLTASLQPPKAAGLLAKVGDLSYGWYLWHWPAIVFSDVLTKENVWFRALAAAMSLVLASITFRFVEDPIRRNQRVVGARAGLLLVVCLGSVAVSAFGLLVLNKTASDRVEARFNYSFSPPSDQTSWPDSCHERGNCSDQKQRLVLVGDSHAVSMSQAFEDTAREKGYVFGAITRAGCMFMKEISTGDYCADWQAEAMSRLADDPPNVVVIAGYAIGRVTELNSGERSPLSIFDASGDRAKDPTTALALYSKGLEAAVKQLNSMGIQVVLISSAPDFVRPPLFNYSLVDALLNRPLEKGQEISLAHANARRSGVLGVEKSVAERTNNGLVVVDPLSLLCTSTCGQVGDGVILYRDQDHLSYSGSRIIADHVYDIVSKAWQLPTQGSG